MPFQARIFWQPKDDGFWKEYEDAYAVNSQRAVAAIADGVSSAMFSGKWARLLVEAIVNGPPDPAKREEFVQWLEPLRAEWERQIDRPNLPFFQKMKLQDCGGGYSTVLWLETLPPENGEHAPAAWRYRGVALGDCCLFHVRGGQIMATFPMQKSADFDLDPASLGSVRHRQDRTLVFQTFEAEYLPDDVLALATDALAAWIFRQVEAGKAVPWDEWAGMSDEEFATWLREVRKALAIRFDDTTLILLKAVTALLEPPPEAPQPAEAEPTVALVAKPSGEATTEELLLKGLDLASTAPPAAQEEAVPAEAVSVVRATEKPPIDAVGGAPQGVPGQVHANGKGPTEPDCAESASAASVAADGDERVAARDRGTEEHPSLDA